MGGWSGGWVDEIIAKSAQIELELGLGFAMKYRKMQTLLLSLLFIHLLKIIFHKGQIHQLNIYVCRVGYCVNLFSQQYNPKFFNKKKNSE